MITHLPGLQSLFSLFASCCIIGQSSDQQHKGLKALLTYIYIVGGTTNKNLDPRALQTTVGMVMAN